MDFVYSEHAGEEEIVIDAELYRYLFKARRSKVGDTVFFRNLKDDFLYGYKVFEISKKKAKLNLESSENMPKKSKKKLHIGWCVIEPKIIEKILPSLNETGVSKITFIYCDRSQKNFKIDPKRLRRILINSCQQCGRSSLMDIEITSSLKDFIKNHKELSVLDFSDKKLGDKSDIKTLLVGCEGGFTEDEKKFFADKEVVGFKTPLILRSETAAISAVSKILI